MRSSSTMQSSREEQAKAVHQALVSEYRSTGLSVVASCVVGSVGVGTDLGTSCLLTV